MPAPSACKLQMSDTGNIPGFESNETADIYRGLCGLAPFRELTSPELSDIAKRMRRHRFAPGTVIVRQGDSGDTFYVVIAGSVEVKRRAAAAGPERQIATLGPGGCFGERALMEDELRNATVMAADEVEVYAMAKADFWDLLGEIPKFRSVIQQINRKRA
jgi:putative ABC transport system ATP-binding protein